MSNLPYVFLGLIGLACAVHLFIDWVAGQVDIDVREEHEE